MRAPARNRPWPTTRAVLVASLIAAFVSHSTEALSEAPSLDDRTMAEALFRSGRELMRQERYSEACRKLEQSQRLVRAAGTLINLAVCHEKEGRVATAWVEYQESLGISIRTNRPDRADIARERMDAIEPTLPHMRIEVPAGSRIEGLVIQRGQTEIPEVSWGVALPTDPGTYTIRVHAPGYEPWTTNADVQLGQEVALVVPRLKRLDVTSPPPVPVSSRTPIPEPARDTSINEAPGEPYPGLRTAGWLACGVGVAVMGTGGYFGVRALQKRSDSDDYCSDDGCYREGVALNNEARELALRSNVLLGAGAVLVASGAIALWTLPTTQEGATESRTRVGVAADRDGVNATFRMAW